MDSIIKELLYYNKNTTVHSMGVAPHYVFEMGSREDMHEMAGIGSGDINNKINQLLGE
jgi:hypothetical protein